MKEFIFQGIKFLGVSVFIYLFVFSCLFFVTKKKVPLVHRISKTLLFWGGNTHKRFEEFDITKQYDILIFGSSHSYNSFDTRLFYEKNIRAYNLGTSGQSLENSLILAKNYLYPDFTKNVILDIYPGAFMSSGLESTCDLVVNVPSNSAALELAWSFPDIRSINMLMLRTFYRNTNYQEPTYNDTRYRFGGFIAVKDSAKTNYNYDNFLQHYRPKKKAINSLKEFVSVCNENKINLVLVAHPAPVELNNEYYKAFTQDAISLSNEFEVEFIDYSFNNGLDSKNHFYDIQHVNEAGAQLFTEKLISTLEEKGIISIK